MPKNRMPRGLVALSASAVAVVYAAGYLRTQGTVGRVAGKRINVRHVDGPVGVQSRNFSNARIYSLGWRPKVFLEEGIALTYPWIAAQVRAAAQAADTVTGVVCPDFECC